MSNINFKLFDVHRQLFDEREKELLIKVSTDLQNSDTKIQIDTIKTLFNDLTNCKENLERTNNITKILAFTYAIATYKHPIKKSLSRFISTNAFLEEIFIKNLSNFIKILINDIRHDMLLECFENFPPGVKAIGQNIDVILPNLIDATEKCLIGINISPKKGENQDKIKLHLLSRITLSLVSQCNISNVNLLNPLSIIASQIIHNISVANDVKGNFGIVLATCIKLQKSEKLLLDELEIFMFSEFSTEAKISFSVGVLNVLSKEGLCNAWLDSIPTGIRIGFYLFELADSSNILLNMELLLVVCRGILQLCKLFPNLIVSNPKHYVDKVLDFACTLLDYVADVRQIAKSIVRFIIKEAQKLKNKGDDQYLIGAIKRILLLGNERNVLYTCMSVISMEAGCLELLQLQPNLVEELLKSLVFAEVSSTVHSTYVIIIKFDSSPMDLWMKTWIIPLLNYIQAENEKKQLFINLLADAISIRPLVANEIIKECNNADILLICTRVIRNSEYYLKLNSFSDSKWNNLIDFTILRQCLIEGNEERNITAFGAIVECHKSTELFSKQDFDLILLFLAYNTNVQKPYLRQQILALIKKMVVRLRDSFYVIKRNLSNLEKKVKTFRVKGCDVKVEEETSRNVHLESDKVLCYEENVDQIKEVLFRNLFPGSNFNRRILSLEALTLMDEFLREEFPSIGKLTKIQANMLLNCLNDNYEINQKLSLNLLFSCQPTADIMNFDTLEQVNDKLDQSLAFISSIRPNDCVNASYLLIVLLHYPLTATVLKTKTGSEVNCSYYLILELLLKEINRHLSIAKSNLLSAASNAPIYGPLLCLRYIYEHITSRKITSNADWKSIINRIIDICIEISEVVSPIVNNSSPEGYLPEDNEILSNQNDSLTKNSCRTTAQMVLLCGWRSIKEVSLLLGEIVIKTTINISDTLNVENSIAGINDEQIFRIGEHFITLLSETKHRGAFEQAYLGFAKLCTRLWSLSEGKSSTLPLTWFNDILNNIATPHTNAKLCATRRSAGLPFMIQAIVVTEIEVNNSSFCFDKCTSTLLELSDPENGNTEARTHSLNILRVLFRHNKLSDLCAKYVAQGIIVSLQGFTHEKWGIRNSSTLLFSTLMVRIFGVQRTRGSNALNIHNKMTVAVFFLRYKCLYAFLLNELEETVNPSSSKLRKLSMFPILLLLGRLYPSAMEGNDSYRKILSFIPLIKECAKDSSFRVREASARALIPFISKQERTEHIITMCETIRANGALNTNHLDGILLQLLSIIKSNHTVVNMEEINSYLIAVAKLLTMRTFIVKNRYCQIISILIDKTSFGDSLKPFLLENIEIFNQWNNFNAGRLGQKSFELELLQLKLKMQFIYSSEEIKVNLIEFIESHVMNSEDLHLEFVLNILICLFERNAFLLEEFELFDFKVEYLSRIQVEDEFLNELRNKTAIINGLMGQLKENQSIECRSKLYVVSSYFVKQIYNLNDGILEGNIYRLIDLCAEEEETVSSGILCVLQQIFFELITADLGICSQKIFTDFCRLFMQNSSFDSSYISRRLNAELFKNVFSVLNETSKLMDFEALCMLWTAVLTLIDDFDQSIRETISLALDKSQCTNELSRETLWKICIDTLKQFSLDRTVEFLLAWILRDANEIDDLDNVNELPIFDKSEDNTFAEDICTTRHALANLKRLLNNNLHNSNSHYITAILEHETISNWFLYEFQTGKKLLLDLLKTDFPIDTKSIDSITAFKLSEMKSVLT